jgi:hypothetical protein
MLHGMDGLRAGRFLLQLVSLAKNKYDVRISSNVVADIFSVGKEHHLYT